MPGVVVERGWRPARLTSSSSHVHPHLSHLDHADLPESSALTSTSTITTWAVNEQTQDPPARRAGRSHDWQTRWSHERGRRPPTTVPSSWQATSRRPGTSRTAGLRPVGVRRSEQADLIDQPLRRTDDRLCVSNRPGGFIRVSVVVGALRTLQLVATPAKSTELSEALTELRPRSTLDREVATLRGRSQTLMSKQRGEGVSRSRRRARTPNRGRSRLRTSRSPTSSMPWPAVARRPRLRPSSTWPSGASRLAEIQHDRVSRGLDLGCQPISGVVPLLY